MLLFIVVTPGEISRYFNELREKVFVFLIALANIGKYDILYYHLTSQADHS